MKTHPVGVESLHASGRTGRYDEPNSRLSYGYWTVHHLTS